VRGGIFFSFLFGGVIIIIIKRRRRRTIIIIIIIISVSFLALHSAVTDWVAILQISQSLSGSTLGDQH
jgi:hypothetical protein